MTKLSLAVAAVATLLAAGGIASAEPMKLAQADVSVRVGGDRGYHHHDRGYHRGWDRGYRRGWHAGCRTVTIKERRGHRVVIKKIRRC